MWRKILRHITKRRPKAESTEDTGEKNFLIKIIILTQGNNYRIGSSDQ
jgi:hypothetical protein